MALKNLFDMVKADRYTADGREAIIKAQEAETEDKVYQIGEISQKTGLQKTANGWVKPKSGKQPGAATKRDTDPQTYIVKKNDELRSMFQKEKDPAKKAAMKKALQKQASMMESESFAPGEEAGAKTGESKPDTAKEIAEHREAAQYYKRKARSFSETDPSYSTYMKKAEEYENKAKELEGSKSAAKSENKTTIRQGPNTKTLNETPAEHIKKNWDYYGGRSSQGDIEELVLGPSGYKETDSYSVMGGGKRVQYSKEGAENIVLFYDENGELDDYEIEAAPKTQTRAAGSVSARRMMKDLDGNFWSRPEDFKEDITSRGWDVEEMTNEYAVISNERGSQYEVRFDDHSDDGDLTVRNFKALQIDEDDDDDSLEDSAPSLSEIVDRVYNIGEISEKTGLQKTANGWRPVKKGAAGKTNRASKEEAIRKDLGLTAGEDMSRFSDEQIEKMYAKTQQTPEQQKADFDKSKIGQAVNKGRQEFAAEKARQKELASKTNAIGLPKESKPAAQEVKLGGGADTYYFEDPDNMSNEDKVFKSLGIELAETFGDHDGDPGNVETWANAWLDNTQNEGGLGIKSKKTRQPAAPVPAEEVMKIVEENPARWNRIIGNAKKFYEGKGSSTDFESDESYPIKLVGGKTKPSAQYYAEGKRNKKNNPLTGSDAAPRVLTGDCRIRIRKEKPALTGDTKIRVRK